MRVGIFGGSFNPIHNGHVALARGIVQRHLVDEVWLMLSPQNPLKQQTDLLDDQQRYDMALKALEGIDSVKACDYELHLPKPSYTWNTLCLLSEGFPQHRFSLIIGGDNWAHFERWRRWKDILRNYNVIVYPRGSHGGNVDLPLLDVSSTEIRLAVRQGDDITGMVPASIVHLVKKYYG